MLRQTLSDLIDITTPFSDLSEEVRGHIVSLVQESRLEAGQVLVEQGQPGDKLYLIVEGSIELTRFDEENQNPVYAGSAGRGKIIGELEMFVGHPCASTMIAATPAVVAALVRADFDWLCLKFPREMESVTAWMRKQLHACQINSALIENPLFRNLSSGAKSELERLFQWTYFPAGKTLFREGDPGDALYLITNGRIHLFQSREASGKEKAFSPDNQQKLAELGKGDVFGEMSLLTSAPRSATAYAVRDTQLARLDRASFDHVIDAFPKEVLGASIGQMAARLRDQNRGGNTQDSPPASIAVLSLTPLADSFAGKLVNSLSAFGSALHLTRENLPTLAGHPVTVEGAESRLLSWLNDQESTFRHVVYEAERSKDAWTLRCLRQADIFFAVVNADEECGAIAAQLEILTRQLEHRVTTHLILFHANPSISSGGTRKWLNAIKVDRHWHVRAGNSEDVSRISRFLTGQSVGLALGGGFAFGLAHIGVIQALREMRIPIDYVGGTSMGAIIAAAYALEFSREQMLEVLEKGCAHSLKGDYTLPIVSLLSGKKVAHAIGKYLDGMDVEDFWLPYFAISASLVHATMVVHTSGNALRTALASCRAPGVFPPLGWNNDVLVDGGLVNNVPCDVMRSRIGSGTVIAVDVSPEADFTVTEQFDMHLSGWKMAGHTANPFGRRQKVTTMAGIFSRLVRFGGVAQARQIRAAADIYMVPPLTQFTFRDFDCGEEMSCLANEYALAQMQQWIDEHGRPWAGSLPN